MAKGKRERGRHYSALAKLNIKTFKPRILLALLVIIVFLINWQSIWAFFVDMDSLLNEFSINAVYVVSYNPNGGEGIMGSQYISFNEPTPLRENEYTNAGYEFNGWNTKSNGTGISFQDKQAVLNSDFTSLDNIVLYAQWMPTSNVVARIGNTTYESLADAIAAVPATDTETTIVLLRSVSESFLEVLEGQNIIFDLQNYTISTSDKAIFEIYGTVHISNGTLYSNSTSNGALNVYTGGKLYYSGGQIINTAQKGKQALYNNGGYVEISGGYFENACKPNVAQGSNLRAAVHNKVGTMVITGGTIVANNYIGLENEGTLTIGVQDNDPDSSTPVIQGATYGIKSSTNFNFYNGISKGLTKALEDETKVTGTEPGYVIAHTGEIINGSTYVCAYLGTSVKTVTFDPNGGVTTETTRTVETNHPITALPVPVYSGHIFDGWFTQQNNGTQITPETIISSDITIYAHWTSANVCELNGVQYDSVKTALTHVSGNTPTTITILRDIELTTSEKIIITNNKIVTFDLQGHTIKNANHQALPLFENQGGTVVINGGTLLNDSSQGAVNNKSGTLTIDGTIIEATGTRQAVYVEGGVVNITGGANLSAITNERATVHVAKAAGTVNIIDATITASNFDAVVNLGTLTIGTPDGSIDISTPTITSKNYGVNNAGTLNFYDGTLKGRTGAIRGTVNNIEANSQRKADVELIDGVMYAIEYLIPN